MGNLLNGNNQSGQNDKPLPKKPMRPPPPLLHRGENSSIDTDDTDDMLDRIDGQLKDWQASVRTLRGNKSEETRQQLFTMMSDTEKELRQINQRMHHSKNRDKDPDEDVLQCVLRENDMNQEKIRKLKRELSEEKRKVGDLQREVEAINEEKRELLLRLSKFAGDKLVDNNPAITDLNDRNRPTKLGELHSELYDNEWTDAFEAFQNAHCPDEFAIETLYLTLLNVFEFCKSKSDRMLRKTEDAVNFLFEEYKLLHETHMSLQHMSMQDAKRVLSRKTSNHYENALRLYKRWKVQTPQHNKAIAKIIKIEKAGHIANHVKLLQKEVAESMAPVVKEAYMKANWIDTEFIPQLEPFLRKCIFLCWMMVVQSPPMCFHQVNKDDQFDKNMYKEYTSSGQKIKFMVWPALLLHENGPLVNKGVVQVSNNKSVAQEENSKGVEQKAANKGFAQETDQTGVAQKADNLSVAKQADNKGVAKQTDYKDVTQFSDNKGVEQKTDNKIVVKATDYKGIAEDADSKGVAQKVANKSVPNAEDYKGVVQEIANKGSAQETDLGVAQKVDKESVAQKADNKGTDIYKCSTDIYKPK